MTFPSTDCAVVEGEVAAGTRNMLLFFTAAANLLWKPAGYTRWLALRAATPRACADEIFAAHPELSSQLLSNSKHAFCVEDEVSMKRCSSLACPSKSSQNSKFDSSYQGISTETDYTNNSGAVNIRILGGVVTMRPQPLARCDQELRDLPEGDRG